ncbi:MAG: DUF5309 family protein [Anaerohalosphaera sp.]|nr:DUF5309 family protein [Anaerohalosphaera sp.]
MAFTGKATYSAGALLPEIAEDVSDVIGIVSPYETPLLDALGDPLRAATSTHHEWLEDELLANKDAVSDASISSPSTETTFDVENGNRFRAGDQVQVEGAMELMFVVSVSGDAVTVIRGYGSTTPEALADGSILNILGNAALEGSDRPTARFTNRIRKGNYTQILTSAVEVSGTDLAASQLGLSDEMDYQKQERLREMIRDLENTVINGAGPISDHQGSDSVRRTMSGIVQSLSANTFEVGDSEFPSGDDLDETKINYVLRRIWENSNGNVDLIVVGGYQKRKLNSMMTALRGYSPRDTVYSDLVSIYESDFGVCKIIATRWMPQDTVLMLDSSRVNVLPLAGRSFHFKPLSSSGDYECGELIGEYTLELKNDAAHGLIRGLTTA